MTLREMLMRKINGVPVEAHTDLSNLTGGEVLKWDSTNTLMAWEDQDSTGYIPLVWYGGRGIISGGLTPISNVIEYFPINTTGNATDFGDLTVGRYYLAACSNGSRGVIGGGEAAAYSNVIDYITVSTTGNATDFGDMTAARNGIGSCSDGTKGVWAGGSTGSISNIIDYVTIDTTGNATDFGDLTGIRQSLSGLSGD